MWWEQLSNPKDQKRKHDQHCHIKAKGVLLLEGNFRDGILKNDSYTRWELQTNSRCTRFLCAVTSQFTQRQERGLINSQWIKIWRVSGTEVGSFSQTWNWNIWPHRAFLENLCWSFRCQYMRPMPEEFSKISDHFNGSNIWQKVGWTELHFVVQWGLQSFRKCHNTINWRQSVETQEPGGEGWSLISSEHHCVFLGAQRELHIFMHQFSNVKSV